MAVGLEPIFAIGYVVLTLGSLFLIWELVERGHRLAAMGIVLIWLIAFALHERSASSRTFYDYYRATTVTTAAGARDFAENESPWAVVVKWLLFATVLGIGCYAAAWWFIDKASRPKLPPWSAAQPGELAKLERLLTDPRYEKRFGGVTKPLTVEGETLVCDGVVFELAEAVLVTNQRNPRLTLKEGLVVEFRLKDGAEAEPPAKPKPFSPDDLPPEMQF